MHSNDPFTPHHLISNIRPRPSRRLTITITSHHDDSSFRRLTITTTHHYDDFPFRRLTITTTHHFDDLPSRRITISTTFHYEREVVPVSRHEREVVPVSWYERQSRLPITTTSHYDGDLPFRWPSITTKHFWPDRRVIIHGIQRWIPNPEMNPESWNLNLELACMRCQA